MNNILKFSDYISESINNQNIVNVIIEKLEDSILNLRIKYEDAYERQFQRPMSDYDKELTRMTIIHDMVRAIEVYTQPTDELIDVKSYISIKGNLEIVAKIKRDDKVYNFTTEVIYAGGHNIQRLHYRYITKTDLPRTNNSSIADEYRKKIKKLSKIQKLNSQIHDYERRIQSARDIISKSIHKTDDEILAEMKNQGDYKEWPTWSEIVRRGADINFDSSEEKYNNENANHISDKLDFWKKKNIIWKQQEILLFENNIKKIRQKLNQLL